MNKVIDESIKSLTEEAIKSGVSASDALKLTQSALNLAHVKSVLKDTKLMK